MPEISTTPKVSFFKNFEANQLLTTFKENSKTLPFNSKLKMDGLTLLKSLENCSVSVVFFDPQYEPVKNVLSANYPLYCQSDYQILRILEQVERVLKQSAFCFL